MSDRRYRPPIESILPASDRTWLDHVVTGVISVFELSPTRHTGTPFEADFVSLRDDMAAVGSDFYAVIAHAQSQQGRTGTDG